MKNIAEIFHSYSKKTTAPLGLGFLNLRTGESEFFNKNQFMPTASTYKIYLMMDIFYKVQQGECSLEDTVMLTPTRKTVGTGILYELENGGLYSIHDLAVLMMALSDNTAADMLGDFLTFSAIHDEILNPLQLNHTRLQVSCKEMIEEMYQATIEHADTSEDYFRKHPPMGTVMNMLNGNYTTAGDLVHALEVIAQGDFFTPESRQQMWRLLSLCQNNTRIPAKLPDTVKISHKTGSLDRISNDAGIVSEAEMEYILVMLYNGNEASRDEYEKNRGRKFSDALLADLSREIYDCVRNGG